MPRPETDTSKRVRTIKEENPHIQIDNIADEVTFIMSMPRLAFTDNMYCLINACAELHIRGKRHAGVYWEQGMENLLEGAIHDNYKYALAIDYDTYYSIYHIVDLYDIMQQNPEIDILLPLQVKRGHKYPMAGMFQDEQGHLVKVFTGGFVDRIADCDTGHFGLTMIKLSALEKISKPWFISITNADNRWRREHKDADVNFWIKAKKSGLIVKLAEVFIGHMELMCSWCGPLKAGYRTHYEGINEVLAGGWPDWTSPQSFKENKNVNVT